jgi:hypothetical protein
MMNKVYDFENIDKIRERTGRLILRYIVIAVGFFMLVALDFVLVENNLLLTLIFAVLMLLFILFSLVYFRVSVGILREYRIFLEKLEMGRQSDFVGVFEGVNFSESNDKYECYVFSSERFFVRRETPIMFSQGEKYHLEHIGKYIYRWEITE